MTSICEGRNINCNVESALVATTSFSGVPSSGESLVLRQVIEVWGRLGDCHQVASPSVHLLFGWTLYTGELVVKESKLDSLDQAASPGIEDLTIPAGVVCIVVWYL